MAFNRPPFTPKDPIYILVVASDTVLGGIKIGNGLDIDGDGIATVDLSELLHNSLGTKQGGAAGEYNHLTNAEYAALHPAVTVVDSTEIDFTLTIQSLTGVLKANSVTFSKLQLITDGKILGASGGTTIEEISIGTGLSLSANTLSSSITQYTDEMAQDAIGTLFIDSAELDFTYVDASNTLTAVLKAGSIDETKLDTSTNVSLGLANTSLQPGAIGVTVQAHNGDTTGKSAKTDALNSATTIVNISAATAPTAGQVLTAVDSTHATWQAPSLGNLTGVITSVGLATSIASQTGTGTKFVVDTSPTLITPKSSTTIGVGNATPAASGAGITFPGTQSDSSDANTLDDYEEGTFVVFASFGGGTTGITYILQAGDYTKIGREVTIYFIAALLTKGSSTGSLEINGLPFTVNAGTRNGGIALSYWGGLAVAKVYVSIQLVSTGTKGIVQGIGAAATGLAVITDTDASNTFVIQGGGSYYS